MPFYNNYRWQRQPEFQDIFNRLFLSAPAVGGQGGQYFQQATSISPLTAISQANGVNTGGYGTIATVAGVGATPRSGQLVARFTF